MNMLLMLFDTTCLQATIMTDPGTADRTYIGPMSPELVEEIIEKVSAMQLSSCRYECQHMLTIK